jgi:ribosomal protein S27E
MSLSRGHAEELLMRGLAAAKSDDPADYPEAEHYLEWVLRTDSDLDQQVDAWYWLSRIAPDPVRKRECLENALAIRPSHPDSRRDLAILEGRLKPQDMRASPAASGAPVVPGQQIAAGEARRFKCPRCGASVTYHPGMESLSCQFCGAHIDSEGQVTETPPSASTGGAGVGEQDWIAAIYTEKGHRWALPQDRVLECQGCGATVTFSPARVSARCAYCASPYTAQPVAPDMADLREPDGVITFRFDAHNTMAYVRWWLGEQARLLGVPDDLQALSTLQMPSPIYIPFWTFDIAGEVRWSGWVRPDIDINGFSMEGMGNAALLGGVALGLLTGNTGHAARNAADMLAKRLDATDLVHVEGAIGVVLTNEIVPATASLPTDPLSKLQYKFEEAVPYDEAILADWPAEIYSISLADASLAARDHAVKQADSQIALETGNLYSKSNQPLQIDRTGLSMLGYKLMLLPVWTVDYVYRGQSYRVLVNGQTGLMEGDAPGKSSLMRKLFVG